MQRPRDPPRWSADDLGKPIPDSEHAVSACLPLWEHNVGYEEGDPAVINRLQAAYPRFCFHPRGRVLFEHAESRWAGPGECCFVFPSRSVAERCVAYLQRRVTAGARTKQLGDSAAFIVILPESVAGTAREYWQHSGEIISSRAADAWLADRPVMFTDSQAKAATRERLASLIGCVADDVYLFPSGMAAIHLAWRAIRKLQSTTLRSVQFGFPYVDTLKILQRFSDDGVRFFPTGSDEEFTRLATIAGNERLTGLFCEIPSNPLLVSPNLDRLRGLADTHSFPLVIDDTLGAFININAYPPSDILVTSLTKFFSGNGDVLAGSLILNPDQPFYSRLKQIIDTEFEDLLLDADAEVLERNSRDVAGRVGRINAGAEKLCAHLYDHPAVVRVYYPRYVTRKEYESAARTDFGFGGLCSIEIRGAAANAPRVFDALRISKGPNLGTSFSLCCPYTILAHYNELVFAEECGISRYLIRVSVGTEDPAHLIRVFDDALSLVDRPPC